jgi:hypothetical protein
MNLAHKKTLLIIFWLAVATVGSVVGSPDMIVAEAKQPVDQQSGKISLCHKTKSQSNPYVFITVAQQGGNNGHQGHSGDIYNVSSPDDCPTSQIPPTSSVPRPTDQPATPVPSVTPNPSETPDPSATPTPTQQYEATNICHATGDLTHPYEFISISDDYTYNLHANHPGDIFDVSYPEDCPMELRKFSADDPLLSGAHRSKKVPICHATQSESNPYIFQTPNHVLRIVWSIAREDDLFATTLSEECPTSPE